MVLLLVPPVESPLQLPHNLVLLRLDFVRLVHLDIAPIEIKQGLVVGRPLIRRLITERRFAINVPLLGLDRALSQFLTGQAPFRIADFRHQLGLVDLLCAQVLLHNVPLNMATVGGELGNLGFTSPHLLVEVGNFDFTLFESVEHFLVLAVE